MIIFAWIQSSLTASVMHLMFCDAKHSNDFSSNRARNNWHWFGCCCWWWWCTYCVCAHQVLALWYIGKNCSVTSTSTMDLKWTLHLSHLVQYHALHWSIAMTFSMLYRFASLPVPLIDRYHLDWRWCCCLLVKCLVYWVYMLNLWRTEVNHKCLLLFFTLWFSHMTNVCCRVLFDRCMFFLLLCETMYICHMCRTWTLNYSWKMARNWIDANASTIYRYFRTFFFLSLGPIQWILVYNMSIDYCAFDFIDIETDRIDSYWTICHALYCLVAQHIYKYTHEHTFDRNENGHRSARSTLTFVGGLHTFFILTK